MISRFRHTQTNIVSRAAARIWPGTLRGRLIFTVSVGVVVAHGALILGLYEAHAEAELDRTHRSFDATSPEFAALDNRVRFISLSQEVAGSNWLRPTGPDRAKVDSLNLHQVIEPTGSLVPGNATRHAVTPMVAMLGSHIVLLLLIGSMFAYVIRRTVRPLSDITAAANSLKPEHLGEKLNEAGPAEVVALAKAFNAMRFRITRHMEERIQMLSAFSHDMQTPITRMRLRAELSAEFLDREKFLRDLDETERLVREGMAYARNAHVNEEELKTIELGSFIDCLALDYQDTERAVSVVGHASGTILTKPQALRRTLSNFVDNALKFSGAAEISVECRNHGQIAIAVMDRGPGIADELLEVVKRPFVRGGQSGTAHVPGTGLGLAIAQQLAATFGGSLNLRQRPGGGLIAELVITEQPHGVA